MILGKRFSRIKRACNAKSIELAWKRKDGTEFKPHRKLAMLIVIGVYGGGKVNLKAIEKESQKFKLSQL